MYKFYYKYITSKFNANLLFTEKDSVVYEIDTENVYEGFYKGKNLFDFYWVEVKNILINCCR